MRETLEIGCSPYGEECAQVGTENYTIRAREECHAYKNQLFRLIEKQFNKTRDELPDGFLGVKISAHDFGCYHEVVARYNDNDTDAEEIAYWLEANSPEYWDDEAKKELKEKLR